MATKVSELLLLSLHLITVGDKVSRNMEEWVKWP